MYLSIFYCLYFVQEISADMVGKQAMEERDPYLEGEEDFRIYDGRQYHCREV